MVTAATYKAKSYASGKFALVQYVVTQTIRLRNLIRKIATHAGKSPHWVHYGASYQSRSRDCVQYLTDYRTRCGSLGSSGRGLLHPMGPSGSIGRKVCMQIALSGSIARNLRYKNSPVYRVSAFCHFERSREVLIALLDYARSDKPINHSN